MYRGFPVGYLMLWNAAEVDAKLIGVNGKQHTPTEFIVDGQQRPDRSLRRHEGR